MERNRTIDFFRFIFSIMVVAVHTDLFADISIPVFYVTTMGLMRAGVPFFFIVSGYFYRQGQINGKSRKPYLLKMTKYWLIFITLDLLIIGHFYYKEYTSLAQFLWKYISCGISGSYWYFTSLIVSLLILSPIFRKGHAKICIPIGLVLYVVAMAHDSYSFLFESTAMQNALIYKLSDLHTKIFFMPQAGLAESVLFLSLGAVIYENRAQIVEKARKHKNALTLTLVALTLILCLEAYHCMSQKAYDGNCYLTLLFLPAALFVWALACDPIQADTTRIGKMSLYIYLVHPILKSLIYLTPAGSVVRTVFALGISLVISLFLTREKPNMI